MVIRLPKLPTLSLSLCFSPANGPIHPHTSPMLLTVDRHPLMNFGSKRVKGKRDGEKILEEFRYVRVYSRHLRCLRKDQSERREEEGEEEKKERRGLQINQCVWFIN